MNPKIQPEAKTVENAGDYPRWTPSMKGFLAGLERFREVLRAQRN